MEAIKEIGQKVLRLGITFKKRQAHQMGVFFPRKANLPTMIDGTSGKTSTLNFLLALFAFPAEVKNTFFVRYKQTKFEDEIGFRLEKSITDLQFSL